MVFVFRNLNVAKSHHGSAENRHPIEVFSSAAMAYKRPKHVRSGKIFVVIAWSRFSHSREVISGRDAI